MGLIYYNYNGENHITIVNNNAAPNYKCISIIENDIFNGFKLERRFNYSIYGTFGGTNLALYDLNNRLIAHGVKDENGNYEYDLTKKYYLDESINSERELFECSYFEDTGLLWELILDEEYDLCSNAMAMGTITELEYKIQKSFYINMREQRIRGFSRVVFIRACKKFIDQEESRKVKMLLNEEDFDGNNIYKTKNGAIVKLISDKLRYHEDGMLRHL